jgi:hypothetical protein
MDFDLGHGVAVLSRTPGVLRELLAGLPMKWIQGNEGENTWSPYNVVGHLIDGEERDWIPRARIILAQGANRRFEPFDRFRHLNRPERSVEEVLDTFAQMRAQNLRALDQFHITPAQLELTGEHPDFGTVSLSQLLATWVAHDLGHIAQITRVMAKQYRDTVGPWKEYLPVLQR